MMRLLNTSMFGQQSPLIHANRVSQSVDRPSLSAKGAHMMQMRRDSVTISPQGKTASLLEHLNKQKANILKRRDRFAEMANKLGQPADSIKTQLEQFDEQIKEIDQQIQEITLQGMKEAAEKSAPKVKSSRPKTKQEAQNDILSNITEASTTLDRIETVSSEKNKLDGNVDVLKSEIELDKSRDSTGSGQESIAEKEALAAQMQSRSQGLMQDIYDGLDEAAEILEENNELSAEKPVEEDRESSHKNDDKDTSQISSKPADSDAACAVKPAPKPQEDTEAKEQTDSSAPQS